MPNMVSIANYWEGLHICHLSWWYWIKYHLEHYMLLAKVILFHLFIWFFNMLKLAVSCKSKNSPLYLCNLYTWQSRTPYSSSESYNATHYMYCFWVFEIWRYFTIWWSWAWPCWIFTGSKVFYVTLKLPCLVAFPLKLRFASFSPCSLWFCAMNFLYSG